MISLIIFFYLLFNSDSISWLSDFASQVIRIKVINELYSVTYNNSPHISILILLALKMSTKGVETLVSCKFPPNHRKLIGLVVKITLNIFRTA